VKLSHGHPDSYDEGALFREDVDALDLRAAMTRHRRLREPQRLAESDRLLLSALHGPSSAQAVYVGAEVEMAGHHEAMIRQARAR
jgi:hypothetical protein